MIPTFPLEDEFGDIIGKARRGKGLSLEETAAHASLDPTVLARMEKYEVKPNQEQAKSLASLLGLHPGRLWTIAQDGYSAPSEAVTAFADRDGRFVVRILPGEPGQAHCYLAIDQHHEQLFIIDPGIAFPRIATALEAASLKPSKILLTHAHSDHVGSVETLVKEFALNPTTLAADGTDNPCLPYESIAVPGHTEDSTCFIFSDDNGPCFAFVGDLLFAGSVGRALPGREWYQKHLESLHKVLSLPPATVLYPGHGPITTVVSEKFHNPFWFRE